jgi:hypothetical protein
MQEMQLRGTVGGLAFTVTTPADEKASRPSPLVNRN